MDSPHCTQKFPFLVDEKPGKKLWCACGLTKNGPYCDGSHKGTPFKPIEVEITEARKVAWCGCKFSHRKPFCDGSHAELP